MRTSILLASLLSAFVTLSTLAEPGMAVATGFGTVDPAMAKTKSQAKMLAKRAAQLDAQRQLSEQVKGIEIRAGSTVEDYEVVSDIIATRVKSWLRGGVVIEEKLSEEDGTWIAEVRMGICLTDESELCKGRETLSAISKSAASSYN